MDTNVKFLTLQAFHSTLCAIFRKGVFQMIGYGYAAAMPVAANMLKHVRTVAAYDHQKVREN